MMQLFDSAGQRKYLTPVQRQDFLRAAKEAPEAVYTFCATLAHTGCRISEALALTGSRVDLAAGVVILESLKKRRKGVFRAVPVPKEFLQTLDTVHGLAQTGDALLWNWSRTTAWRRVKEVMEAASIRGLYATPKGVRHGFGVKATTSDVPLNMTQKWMGHARLETTTIYADAVGPEERKIAARMWA
ncbi:MAG: tyrosine-type recombinase/integrase [Bryobacterales bacterium]|nr:tyrosine-type recombinase/integrase [Bryobacterales bacterium]